MVLHQPAHSKYQIMEAIFLFKTEYSRRYLFTSFFIFFFFQVLVEHNLQAVSDLGLVVRVLKISIRQVGTRPSRLMQQGFHDGLY